MDGTKTLSFDHYPDWTLKSIADVAENFGLEECLLCSACCSRLSADHFDHMYRVPDYRYKTDYFDILLCAEHQMIKLDKHPNRLELQQAFNIQRDVCKGVCRKCQKSVNFTYGAYVLQNHLELYHNEKSYVWANMRDTEKGSEVLDRYVIRGNEAKCIKCDLSTYIRHPSYHEEFISLLGHWNYHFCTYEKKIFLYLPKRTQFRFCFICFVSKIS